jgi:omega-amidase
VVNIAILQLRQYDNLDGLEYNEKAFEHIRKMIHDASYDHKIDVICMPELWYTKLVKDFEKEFRTIISAASEYNVTIIPGAFTEKIAGNVYVSCPSLLQIEAYWEDNSRFICLAVKEKDTNLVQK